MRHKRDFTRRLIMNLQSYIKHDIVKIRQMNHDDIFRLHKDTYICPDGMTYTKVVKCMKFLMKKLGLILTSEQLHLALSCQEGAPVVVEACPGAGKTTISQFILFCDMLIHNVNRNKMLLTSFSTESSMGMQEKNLTFAKKLNTEPVTRIKTMHSWYFSFLKEHIKSLGLPESVTELTTLETGSALKTLRSCYSQVTGDKYPTNNLLNRIMSLYTYIYDALIFDKPEEIRKLRLFKEISVQGETEGIPDNTANRIEKIERNRYKLLHEVFKKFDNSKHFMGTLDFTDMQVLFLKLLQERPDIRQRISAHFDLILIDEAQDTSKLQLKIYSLLVGPTNKARFRIVGDNDQSIYRWRGTSKTPFEDFFQVFPDAQLCTLGYNMRSGEEIIEHANKLIAHTEGRVDKHMTSPRGLKSCVHAIPTRSRLDAVNQIYAMLERAYKSNTSDYSAMRQHCVLVRNNNQALWLVDKLLSSKIPVRLISSVFPYNDKIITDMLTIMNAVTNPTASDVGSEAIPKLCQDVKATQSRQVMQQINLGRKLYEVEFDLARVSVNKNYTPTFEEDMKIIKQACELSNPTVAQLCKLLIPLYRKGSYDFYAKRQSIDSEHYELLFDYLLEQNVPVNVFQAKLITIREQLEYNSSMDLGFRISSMHGAKGREYDNVYLLDCSGNSCPDMRKLCDYEPEQAYDYLLEERNLWYVAITRAIKNLYVTYNANNPSLFNLESEIIQESHINRVQPLPPKLLNYIDYKDSTLLKVAEGKEQLEEVTQMSDSMVISQKPYETTIKQVEKSITSHKIRLTPQCALISKLDTTLNDHYMHVLQSLKF